MNEIEKRLLEEVSSLHEIPMSGAYNIRLNKKLYARSVSEDINIVSKKDKDGIDIFIKNGTKNKSVHLPVIVSFEGIKDKVYNDFYVGDDVDVLIVAGCGVSCGGNKTSGHNGIHTFHIGKNSKVRYVEKHVGIGGNKAKRVLDPVTEIFLGENSTLTMETSQLGGVTKSTRTTNAYLKSHAKLIIKESLLTSENDRVKTIFNVDLDEKDSKVEVTSRSVARGKSKQEFISNVVGKNRCFGHVECDGIISEEGELASTPKIVAKHTDAQLVHEAAIGKIGEGQIEKLMTLGLTKEEAEKEIISGFLR